MGRGLRVGVAVGGGASEAEAEELPGCVRVVRASASHRTSNPNASPTPPVPPPPSFGEMALLHGAPREATFKAAAPNTVLWSLSRDAYRSTVKEAVEKRRNAHKDFLRGVAAFESLTDYDVSVCCVCRLLGGV